MARLLPTIMLSVLIVAAMTVFRPPARAAEKDLAEAGVNVQARGPVHEAFAQPTTAAPDPAPLVPKAPPDPIPEEPPDQKPDAANVQWIPGYWSWDAEKKDWLWVSGFWRTPPPARRWVPGHWAKTDDGWRWIAGLWAPASSRELNYVEAPPDSLESGPTVPAPDDGSIYVPGLWVFRSGRFLWRPGYWLAGRPDWVWCAAHYVWTPRGYVFVDGYWDYSLEDRGCLFAPVFFDQPLWTTPGWCYRPRFVVDIGGLFGSLWVYPSCSCYCFGDYYDPFYARLGFQPWFAYGARQYDPLFGFYGWRHRSDPAWVAGLKTTFTARTRGEVARPAATFAAQVKTGAPALLTPLAQMKSIGNVKLTTVDSAQLAEHRQTVKVVRELAVQRSQLEKPNASIVIPAAPDLSPKLRAASPPASNPPIIHVPAQDAAPLLLKGATPVAGPSVTTAPSIVTAPSGAPVVTRPAPPPPARVAQPPAGGGGRSGPSGSGGGHSSGGGGHGHGGSGGHSNQK